MAFVTGIAEDDANGVVAEFYAADRAGWGFVPNFATTFSLRPEAYAAWRQLNGAVKASMSLRRYELATLAAAVALRSSYCSLAHGRVLADEVLSPDDVTAIVTDPQNAPLDATDRAVMTLARKVVEGADRIGADDLAELRTLGLDDGEILSVILAAAARCFFSKVLDATGTLPDSAFTALPASLAAALTVGRPIDAAP